MPSCRRCRVPLVVNTTRPFRSHGEVLTLIRAILDANPEDEPEWLEWKSTLDLRRDGLMVAKVVLGLANRLPERARLHCEGVGYLVVGAADRHALPGVAEVDLATVQQIVDSYVGPGADAPSFAMRYYACDGKTVFVATVETPRPGDPIFALHKEGQLRGGARYADGTVFVRRGSSTVQASAADLRALQQRLLAGTVTSSPELQVEVVGGVPVSWFDLGAVQAAIATSIEVRSGEMVAAARSVEAARHPPPPWPGQEVAIFAGLQAQMQAQRQLLSALGNVAGLLQDRRSLEQFVDQVDRWREEATRASFARFERLYSANGFGRIGVKVTNTGNRFLEGVRIEMTFPPGEVDLRDDLPGRVHLPPEPWEYGKLTDLVASSLPRYVPSAMVHLAGLLAADHEPSSIVDGSTVSFWLGDLRQGGTGTSANVYLVLDHWPEPGSISVSWTASARSADGITTGAGEVAIAREAIDHGDLVHAATSVETD
jgi:hypothetical protein